jgi:hypothetical protein
LCRLRIKTAGKSLTKAADTVKAEIASVVSHPGDKNKDVARMGHPDCFFLAHEGNVAMAVKGLAFK